MVEWWNSGLVGGASPAKQAGGKMCCLGVLSVDFRRIFSLLEGQPPHN